MTITISPDHLPFDIELDPSSLASLDQILRVICELEFEAECRRDVEPSEPLINHIGNINPFPTPYQAKYATLNVASEEPLDKLSDAFQTNGSRVNHYPKTIEELRATPATIPNGWKLVPIDPTVEMYKAMAEKVRPGWYDAAVWKAALDAAPKPEL